MDLKQLRRRCEARLRELDLPIPFDVHAFGEALARQRGRPIRLQPVAGGTRFYGLWVATPAADVVLYECRTSRLHQDHIILHELCHVACGHEPAPVAAEEATQLLFPDVRPEPVQRLLRRAGSPTDEEFEAELLASLILERAAGDVPLDAAPLGAEVAQVLGRLEATLEDGSS